MNKLSQIFSDKNHGIIAGIISIFLLSLIVLFPIFHSGSILLLDNTASPIPFKLFNVYSISRELWQKVYLIITVTSGLLAICLVLKKHKFWSIILASLFWISSPFVIEHLVGARWDLTAAVSLTALMIFFSTWLPHRPKKLAIVIILALALLTYKIYPRAVNFFEIISIAGLVSVICSLQNWSKYQKIIVSLFGAIIIVTFFSYITNKYMPATAAMVTSHDLPLFAIKGNNWQTIVGNVISYKGFWGEDKLVGIVKYSLVHIISGLILLIISIYGWIVAFRRDKCFGIFLAGLYIISFGLVISNNYFTNPDVMFNIYTKLGFIGLRETSKFMGLMLISQAIGLGFALDHFISKRFNFDKIAILILVVWAIGLNIVPTTNNAKLGLTPVKYPSSLINYAKFANAQHQKVIVLPWHRFQVYPFSHGVVDQIGEVLFDNYTYNDSLEFGEILTQSLDPWQQDMMNITSQANLDSDKFMENLKQRNVNQILIFKTNDCEKYIDWATQNNLQKIVSKPEFEVYQLPK